nr:immunoglobulin heavy chain junction region [Macaca mulatta]
CARQQSNLDVW